MQEGGGIGTLEGPSRLLGGGRPSRGGGVRQWSSREAQQSGTATHREGLGLHGDPVCGPTVGLAGMETTGSPPLPGKTQLSWHGRKLLDTLRGRCR